MKDFLFWKKVKKKSKALGLFLVPIFLCVVAILGWGISQVLSWQISTLPIVDNPFPHFQAAAYPVVERQYVPEVSANAVYVMEAVSRVPVFTKNSTIRFSPASTTKIMTALVALDYYKLSDALTIKRDFVEGSGLRLVKGEKFTFEKLLYAMMLPSANDAAYAIADNYPGGMQGFVVKMNEKAGALHLVDTHYQDSAGLTDDGDFTTAHDLAILASVAIGDPVLAKVVNTKSAVISSVDGIYTYPIKNLNELLGLYGVIGVKTGYTDEAGQVLVTASRQNNHVFIIVVMKSDDRFGDTEKLLQYISQNISYVSMHL